jgi:hypothetical protein
MSLFQGHVVLPAVITRVAAALAYHSVIRGQPFPAFLTLTSDLIKYCDSYCVRPTLVLTRNAPYRKCSLPAFGSRLSRCGHKKAEHVTVK